MPAQPLIADLPQEIVLSAGYVVRITALNPATGAAVTGVRVTDLAFQVRPSTADIPGSDGGAPLPLLVPTTETA
jgi:hypothetical protein